METTVYVREDRKKMGIGRNCTLAGKDSFLAEYPESNACIACPEAEDPGLADSVQFHERWDINCGKVHRAGTSSAAGTIWCGWKNIWETTRQSSRSENLDEIRGLVAEQYGILKVRSGRSLPMRKHAKVWPVLMKKAFSGI
ncbi:MAG: hypothetical protein ACLT8E_08285 [Akkermansia sp.]